MTHAAVPLSIGLGLGSAKVPRGLLIAGVLAAMVPDLDVIGFRFGVAYSDILGHRGFSHSLSFAAAVGFLALLCAPRFRVSGGRAFAFVFVAIASHGFLDMLTNGGLGVCYAWPLSDARYFLPVRVIEASPLGLRRLFGASGLRVATSEALWVWLPAAVLALLLRRCSRGSGEPPRGAA